MKQDKELAVLRYMKSRKHVRLQMFLLMGIIMRVEYLEYSYIIH